MSPWLVHSNYGGDTETPPPLLASRGGAMPTQPILVDPGHVDASVATKIQYHPDLGQRLFIHVTHCTSCTQNGCFCSTRLSRIFFCMFWFHVLQKWLILQHRTIANFFVLSLIRFAGQNYREILNLHFLSSKRGLSPQMP